MSFLKRPLSPIYHYEKLLAEGNPKQPFIQDLDENAPAGMCYTSATTGNPKGVVYSHRGILLHAIALGLADSTAISERDVALASRADVSCECMGHAICSVWFGTKMVLPGPISHRKFWRSLLKRRRLQSLQGFRRFGLGLLKELEEGSHDTSSIRAVLCGGSAAPKSMIKTFEQKYNIPFLHAYGMTETSPLVFVSETKKLSGRPA